MDRGGPGRGSTFARGGPTTNREAGPDSTRAGRRMAGAERRPSGGTPGRSWRITGGPPSRASNRGAILVDLIRISIAAAAGLMLAASIWVLLDARRLRLPTRGNTYTTDTGALAWFLG